VAVSGDRLTRAVSGRRSVQTALLAGVALIHAARISDDLVWPEKAQYRGLVGRLWEIASHDPRIRVVPGPRFKLPRQHDIRYREARLFVRVLFWESSRNDPPTGSCQVTLLSSFQDIPKGMDALELQWPTRRDSALYLLDGCGGRVTGRILSP
jgi:hypothetical protein